MSKPNERQPQEHQTKWIERGVRPAYADYFEISLDPNKNMRVVFGSPSTTEPGKFVISSINNLPPQVALEFFRVAAEIAHHSGIELPPAPIRN